MADISITAANVLASSGATIRREYLAGATITAGQVVYLNSSNQWVLADSNAGATGNGVNDLRGIALNGASSGQPLSVVTNDPAFTTGGTMVNGATYYTGNTAGAISNTVPTTGDYPTVLGLGISTTKINLQPFASGVVI